MPTAAKADILVRLVGDQQVRRRVQAISKSFSGLSTVLAQGLGMGVGFRVADIMARAVSAMRYAVAEGVRFNQTLEDTRISLAGLLRALSPENFRDFQSALHVSTALVERLREEAVRTNATFEDLLFTTQGLLGPAMSAGIPLSRIPDLVLMIANAVKTMLPGQPPFQMLQEGRALLTGQIDRGAMLARSLGITRQQIMAAQQQGRLYEFLADKLKAFKEAGDYAARTLSQLKSNLQDAFSNISAERMKPVFEGLKDLIHELGEQMKSKDFQRGLKTLSAFVNDTIIASAKLGLQAGEWVGPPAEKGMREVLAFFRGAMGGGRAFFARLLTPIYEIAYGVKPSIRDAEEAAQEFHREAAEAVADLRAAPVELKKTKIDLSKYIGRAGPSEEEKQKIKKSLESYQQYLQRWFADMIGRALAITQRDTHGLGLTAGALIADRERVAITRSILREISMIRSQITSGIQVRLQELDQI